MKILAALALTLALTSHAAADLDMDLSSAAQAGNVAKITKLIAAGADPNGAGRPLGWAAFYGHTAAVVVLLDAGAQPDPDHQLLLQQLKLSLPAQPPPRICV